MNEYVVALSKAWVCRHSLAWIAGSNSAGGMEVSLLWVLCVWGIRGLCDGPIPRPEESYLVCVRPRFLNFEAA